MHYSFYAPAPNGARRHIVLVIFFPSCHVTPHLHIFVHTCHFLKGYLCPMDTFLVFTRSILHIRRQVTYVAWFDLIGRFVKEKRPWDSSIIHVIKFSVVKKIKLILEFCCNLERFLKQILPSYSRIKQVISFVHR